MLTLLIAMLPIFELRGSIPFAILSLGESPSRAFWFSVLGNLLPVIPLLIIFSNITKWLEDVKDKPKSFIKTFLTLLFEHVKKRSLGIERLESIGLAIFVTVPLPGTGVWTACIIAALFRLHFLCALISITVGVIIAGALVTWMTIIGKMTIVGLLR